MTSHCATVSELKLLQEQSSLELQLERKPQDVFSETDRKRWAKRERERQTDRDRDRDRETKRNRDRDE